MPPTRSTAHLLTLHPVVLAEIPADPRRPLTTPASRHDAGFSAANVRYQLQNTATPLVDISDTGLTTKPAPVRDPYTPALPDAPNEGLSRHASMRSFRSRNARCCVGLPAC